MASEYYRNPGSEIKDILIFESSKIKLFFNDETLNIFNKFIDSNNKDDKIKNYNLLMEELKKTIK